MAVENKNPYPGYTHSCSSADNAQIYHVSWRNLQRWKFLSCGIKNGAAYTKFDMRKMHIFIWWEVSWIGDIMLSAFVSLSYVNAS